MKEEKRKEMNAEQKVYVALLVAGIIALASLTLLYGKKAKKMDDLVEQNIELTEDSPVSGQVSTKEEEETTEAEVETVKEQAEEEETSVKEAEPAARVQEKAYNGTDKLAWPVMGSVLIPYSMDTTVYFETLDQYQCNPALYIQAEKGTDVGAVYGGRVSSVIKDDRLGNLVTIDMGNGYEATYGQIEGIPYEEGDYVETGSVIGKIAEPTNFYMLEGSHLYIRMTKDNKPVNPTDYFES